MAETDWSSTTIAILDDEVDLARVTQAILAAEGFDAIVFTSSDEYLQRMNELSSLRLLIVDIIMPVHDGLEVIREMRRTRPNVAIIALSGGGREFGAALGLRAAEAIGADAVAYKPVSPPTLIGLVRQALDRRRSDRPAG